MVAATPSICCCMVLAMLCLWTATQPRVPCWSSKLLQSGQACLLVIPAGCTCHAVCTAAAAAAVVALVFGFSLLFLLFPFFCSFFLFVFRLSHSSACLWPFCASEWYICFVLCTCNVLPTSHGASTGIASTTWIMLNSGSWSTRMCGPCLVRGDILT